MVTSLRLDPVGLLKEDEEQGLRIDAGDISGGSLDRTVYDAAIVWVDTTVLTGSEVWPAFRAELRGQWSVIVPELDGVGVIVRGINSRRADPLVVAAVDPILLADDLGR